METSLVPFVLDQAPAFGTQIPHYACQQVLEVLECAPRAVGIIAYEFAVTDVESRAVAVGALSGGVPVDSAQFPDSKVRPQQARHLEPVGASAVRIQRVGESPAYLLQKVGSLRTQIWI